MTTIEKWIKHLEDMDALDKATGRENGEAPGTIHAEMAEFLKQFRDTRGSIDMDYFADFRKETQKAERFSDLGVTEVKVDIA